MIDAPAIACQWANAIFQPPFVRRELNHLSGLGGLWIISPEGKHRGTIMGPEHPHNFAWGDDDGKTLNLCAKTGL